MELYYYVLNKTIIIQEDCALYENWF